MNSKPNALTVLLIDTSGLLVYLLCLVDTLPTYFSAGSTALFKTRKLSPPSTYYSSNNLKGSHSPGC
ncbi:hypothetical protein AG1IA_01849 [Rhizoctonia solani AG-1 IA]|uniref:Uncharacterized protein n=1 Tax=Thanatephorus cucumeris (strain AG1-IA) TaxID=983506 RepID=L8X4T1_THACA|nr:hypothetical protein AG1IA_01849 [Rhizoctonia solani AG-1 IA]